MSHVDVKGLPVSTASADALAAYERGLDLFLRWRAGSLEALDAAIECDPRFALADAAREERERLHVEAADAVQRGDYPAAYDRLGAIAARHPTDRMAVRIVG